MKKPSDFVAVSNYNSILQKSECEDVCRNIMLILSRTGDEWRKLSFEEYKKEREADFQRTKVRGDAFFWKEKEFFDKVIGYTVSEDAARLFCNNWKNL